MHKPEETTEQSKEVVSQSQGNATLLAGERSVLLKGHVVFWTAGNIVFLK